jgi:hypothetical protein
MNNNIYYILGALLVVYLLIGIFNKRTARRRRSRKFMEGYERKERNTGNDSGDSGQQEKSNRK